MQAKTNDVWVFIETDETGNAKDVGIELLNPGRTLADRQKGRLAAVIIGSGIEKAVDEANRRGADIIICVDAPEYRRYTTDAYAAALYSLVEKYAPLTLIIGATPNGRDLGPRVSCRLKTGLTADCTGLDIDEAGGNVLWTRPAFGGNLMAQIQCADTRPQMGTVRPGVFKKPPVSEPRAAIIREDIRVSRDEIRTQILEVVREIGGGKVDLQNAEIIVAGGRGVGGAAGFSLIRELADVLSAMVGASRAAVDAGWIPHAHQVGQTGKTVSPKLYIACGISGAVQHTAGIAGAETVVAINSDPNAPIFGVADYGVVGDMFEVLPALIGALKRGKASAPSNEAGALPPAWVSRADRTCHIELIPPKHDTDKLEKDLKLFKTRFDAFQADGFITSLTDNAMSRLAFQGTLPESPHPDALLLLRPRQRQSFHDTAFRHRWRSS